MKNKYSERLFLKQVVHHLMVLIKSWYWLLIFLLRYLFNKSLVENNYKPGVTVVITSCNRPEQLKETLKSFIKYNTAQISSVVLVEDGGNDQTIEITQSFFKNITNFSGIKNPRNIGQLNSIDKAYALVDTEWIFHLEDDWEFVKSGFIEDSIKVMTENKKIIYTSLRHYGDQNGHPVKNYNSMFYQLRPFWKGVWVGFGFNPSLRRHSDYDLIGKKYGGWNKRETSIGLFYHFLGYKVLVSKTDKFYIKHTGFDCSTEDTYQKA